VMRMNGLILPRRETCLNGARFHSPPDKSNWSQNQRERAFKRRPLQSWSGATSPLFYSMRNPVGQRSAIGAVATFQRPRDTNEFDLQFVSRGARHRIAVPADVDEGKVRGDLRVSLRERLTRIARPLQREARAHAVHQRDVYRRLRGSFGRRLIDIDGPQRMILGEGIFRRLEEAGRRDRAGDEFGYRRLEALRLQRG
jgi:hypothetical protein